MKAQAVADHLLVTPDGGLNPAALAVARGLLPPDSAFLGNALKMAVAPGGFGPSAASLGAAVERGGTMIAVSGSRSRTAR
jgi:hypothetical protein